MSDSPVDPPERRRRFILLIVVAGLVGAAVMSLAMTNTLSAFVASITNSNDTAATGSIVLQETGATGTAACNSTDGTGGSVSTNAYATCTTFNKYGGNTTMVPSNAAGTTNTQTTTVNFKNTGSIAASSFTMAFGACTQSTNGASNGSATDFCTKLHVKVVSGATTVQADTTAAALANTTVALPAALIPAASSGTTIPFTFTTYIDSSAGNTYQGLQASQPITWTLST